MASNDSSSNTDCNNATEYLLSELLEVVKENIADNNAQTDWDPITFAFTVPVGIFGILATFLALVTIIQGILAASPGRRKSSHHVIGKWAKTRKTTFNWDELRTMTFVETPVLRAEVLFKALIRRNERKGKKVSLTATAKEIFAPQIPYDAFMKPKKRKEQMATKANWVRLMDYFNLGKIQFGASDLELTATDHIPDELRAVYAYTDVRTMIALGAVAKAISLEPEAGSSYPILVGDEIQIEFRQHPVLGTVAAFSNYGTERRRGRPVFPSGSVNYESFIYGLGRHERYQQVPFALKHSNAEVEFIPPKVDLPQNLNSSGQNEGISNNIQPQRAHFIKAIGNKGTDRPVDPMRYTIQELVHGIRYPLRYCEHNQGTMCLLTNIWNLSEYHNLLWLFVAQVPSQAPAVFPSSAVAIRKSLTTLCLLSRFWSGDRAQQSIKRLYSVQNEVKDSLFTAFRRYILQVENKAYEDTILQICLQFLHGRSEVMRREQRVDDEDLIHLILVLDTMLSTVPEAVIGCRKANLFLTTLIVREVSCGIADGSFKTSEANSDAPTPLQGSLPVSRTMMREHWYDLKQLELCLDKGFERCRDEMPGNFFIMTYGAASRQQVYSDDDPEAHEDDRSEARIIFKRLQDVTKQCAEVAKAVEGQPQLGAEKDITEVIDDMIIWRTILIGILFCSAPDNSKVYQSAVWNHVVPLL
ncbi:hypothetical protein G7054_g13846 [Neopestalotiopsis clavispora]|nr:hypothetical protein G7054_g13846 [Neopestalotiopsis clavispora]